MSIRSDWPKHAAAPGTHEKVLSIVLNQVTKTTKKNITACDVPCGAGSFSRRLAESGINVTAVDIAAADNFIFDPTKRILHDCNKGLPFDKESLDFVISIEGIEHLENPSEFIRECARVAKPGGLIILTTPNVDSFRSRKYAFFRGYHKYFGPSENSQKDSGHLLPVDAMFVVNTARKSGLEIVDITSNRQSGKTLLIEFFRKRLQANLPDYLQNPSLYYGEVAIYVMRKN
ncbi:MAG: class I SAM-dependent methyltransferase [Betaproteobacteria bacterium]